jgi:hypothetical protein
MNSTNDQIVGILDNILNKVCANYSNDKYNDCEKYEPKRRVSYVYSRQLLTHCNRLPKVKGRVSLSLIEF